VVVVVAAEAVAEVETEEVVGPETKIEDDTTGEGHLGDDDHGDVHDDVHVHGDVHACAGVCDPRQTHTIPPLRHLHHPGL
jgi:hypothetical protein